jgi:hypothetical protein
MCDFAYLTGLFKFIYYRLAKIHILCPHFSSINCAPSLTRGQVCVCPVSDVFVRYIFLYILHIYTYNIYNIYMTSVSSSFVQQIISYLILLSLCYNGSLVNSSKLRTTQKTAIFLLTDMRTSNPK